MFHSCRNALGRLLVIALPIAGCGAATIEGGDIATAQSAVRGAEEAGAEREPKAALHLKMARDQIAEAKAAAADGDEDRAAQLLERAELDAELAVALSRKADAIEQARQAEMRADAVGRETTVTGRE